jgi:hypothetical protein
LQIELPWPGTKAPTVTTADAAPVQVNLDCGRLMITLPLPAADVLLVTPVG